VRACNVDWAEFWNGDSVGFGEKRDYSSSAGIEHKKIVSFLLRVKI